MVSLTSYVLSLLVYAHGNTTVVYADQYVLEIKDE